MDQNQLNDLIEVLKRQTERLDEKGRRLEQKEKLLEAKDASIMKLVDKILKDEPKIAVMPEREEKKHVFCPFTHKIDRKRCKCVRAQRRNLKRAISCVGNDYELAYRRDAIPNGINVLNCIKELIPKNEYSAKNNEIITDRDPMQHTSIMNINKPAHVELRVLLEAYKNVEKRLEEGGKE